MDIDDILREVDPTFDSIPEETRDLQALTRAWMAERSSPELLDWPADGLFERINERIKQQIEKVEDMTGDMDPKTNFALIVIQTELERYKYLNLNDTAGNISMVDAPDLDTAVFIRLLKDTLVEGRGTDADGEMNGKNGDVVILRWADAKKLVDSGSAEVI
ncbi:hypothetical protein ABKA04_010128 [Annulohypoxylon sp. FPYF3050]